MTINEMLAEIRDTNLNYLMLAQQLIRADRAGAIFRLGLNAEVADLLEHLSTPQLLKLAATPMMLARFRFDDQLILGMLTSHTKDHSLIQPHAAILMAGQPVEEAWAVPNRSGARLRRCCGSTRQPDTPEKGRSLRRPPFRFSGAECGAAAPDSPFPKSDSSTMGENS